MSIEYRAIQINLSINHEKKMEPADGHIQDFTFGSTSVGDPKSKLSTSLPILYLYGILQVLRTMWYGMCDKIWANIYINNSWE